MARPVGRNIERELSVLGHLWQEGYSDKKVCSEMGFHKIDSLQQYFRRHGYKVSELKKYIMEQKKGMETGNEISTGKRKKIIPPGMVHVGEIHRTLGKRLTEKYVKDGVIERTGYGLYSKESFEKIKAEVEERKRIRVTEWEHRSAFI